MSGAPSFVELAGRGENPRRDLAARRQDPVAWDDQGNGIPGHGLADVARRLAAGPNLLRQRAVSGRAAPPDPAQGLVNPAEESILVAEVEPDLGKVRFLATEVPLRRRDDRRNVFRRRSGLRAGDAAAHQALGGLRALRGQLEGAQDNPLLRSRPLR